MEKKNLKEKAEAVDICDLRTATERTELELRVSKIEQIPEMIQFLKSVLIIHLGHLFVVLQDPFPISNWWDYSDITVQNVGSLFWVIRINWSCAHQPKSDF